MTALLSIFQTLQQPVDDPTQFLPRAWSQVMNESDRKWIAKVIYTSKGQLVSHLKLWWHPPAVPQSTATPDPDRYFTQPLFLWMPRRMWGFRFTCKTCPDQELTSKGLYNHVCNVVDVSSKYYLATEYLECRSCKKTYISWSQDILNQLDAGHRAQFPAVLTYKNTCDLKIVKLMRARTLGNSSTFLMHGLEELHSESWMRTLLLYLTDCDQHQSKQKKGVMKHMECSYKSPPKYQGLTSYKWLLACYARDVLSRLEEIKAQITSVYGKILKMDSTKKVSIAFYLLS